MRRLQGIALALLAMGAGCISEDFSPAGNGDGAVAAAARSFGAPADVIAECPALRGVACFEPTLAVDPEGRIFVVPGLGQEMARSLDGGATFDRIPTPPLPPTAEGVSLPGDNTLQIDGQGRLYYSAIVLQSVEIAGMPILTQYAAGLHVGRSDDGGDTWAVSTYLALNAVPPAPVAAADRQWLVFGEGDVVYLQYWRFTPGQAFVARSSDGGASFGAFLPAPGIIPGKGMTDADGRLLLPTWRRVESGDEVVLAASTDGGVSWGTLVVHRGTDRVGHLLVSGAVAGDGSLHVAWRGADGEVLVASSRDGGASWDGPVEWTAPDLVSPDAGPLVLANADRLEVAWYQEAGKGQELVLAHAPLADVAAGPAARTVVATLPGSEPTSDFAWLTLDADGRAHAAWTDHDLGVRYASELDG